MQDIPLVIEVGMWVAITFITYVTIFEIVDRVRARKMLEREKANGRIIYHFPSPKRKRAER